jgi:hypothetical protein
LIAQEHGNEKARELYKSFGNPASFNQLDPKYYDKLLTKMVEFEITNQGNAQLAQNEFL